MNILAIEKTAFYIGAVGLIFIPFSISITQLFLYTASLLSFILLIKKKFNYTLIFKCLFPFILLYVYLFIITIIQNESLNFIISSEWKDVFLILFFFWSYYFSGSNYSKNLFRLIIIIFFIFIGVGFISLFTPFRLGNLFYHLQHGFIFDGKYRAQHLIFPLDFISLKWNLNSIEYPMGIYMPVGFYGTHLSFGSVIALISFYFLSLSLLKFNYKSFYKKSLLLFMTTGISILILFFSQARSSIFGFIVIFLLFLILLIKSYTFNEKLKVMLKTSIYLFLILISIVIIAMMISPYLKELILQTSGIEKKHTDYQRNLLWYVSIKVFLNNPLVGYGAGNFKDTIFNEILNIIKEKPLLWYPFYQTEIMHGHNDLIHFLVSGGILGGFFYIWFFYQQFKVLFENNQNVMHKISESQNFHLHNKENFLIFLFFPVFLLFAGMFQCYFLSDHTMQLFWILYGISLRIIT